MTKKHFIAIAAIIRANTEVSLATDTAVLNRAGVIADLVTMFNEDNPHFNAAKFIAACNTYS